jgi:hypothetical protein
MHNNVIISHPHFGLIIDTYKATGRPQKLKNYKLFKKCMKFRSKLHYNLIDEL